MDEEFQADLKKLSAHLAPVGNWISCPICSREFNKLMPSNMCFDCSEDSVRQSRKLERLKQDFSPLAFDVFTFDNFIVTDGNKKAFEATKRFNPFSDNLYLFGDVGVGKSHLAFAAARSSLLGGYDTMIKKSLDLSRYLRGLSGKIEEERLRELINYSVLIIDDLGFEKSTEFLLEKLYEIVDGRWMNKKNGLIITSNLSLALLAEKFGDDRLTSRIAGICRIISVSGDDMRSKP